MSRAELEFCLFKQSSKYFSVESVQAREESGGKAKSDELLPSNSET